ncbi:MAG: hypothetical protein IPJ74_11640 [Saprospiraceae bacterium]|nr:hypothetical protein [Saprospiraceae bacterium]
MKSFTVRVVIPTNIGELLKLATRVYKKHQADGKTSLLHSLVDYRWDEIGHNLELAAAKHEEAEELSRLAEIAYRERDRLMGDVSGLIRATRDLLKGIFRKSPKKLGEWGFEVNDTPRPGKAK